MQKHQQLLDPFLRIKISHKVESCSEKIINKTLLLDIGIRQISLSKNDETGPNTMKSVIKKLKINKH